MTTEISKLKTLRGGNTGKRFHFGPILAKESYEMKIVNLTPHALHVRRVDGTDITLEPSGTVPRLDVTRAECAPVICDDGVEIAVSRATFGALTGMPPVSRSCRLCGTVTARHERINGCKLCSTGPLTPNENERMEDIIYVVSALCAQSPEMAGRSDVFAPGEALRDSAGKIIGTTGLSRINPLAGAR